METATFDPKTLKPNQVNIGTLQNPNIITSVPSKIKATNLSNGSTPFTNPVNDNTASTKLGAAVETVSNSAVLGRATPETPVQTQAPKKAVMDRMLEIIGLQKEQGQRTLDLQQEERVFEKKKLAQKLENDIISKTQAYDRQIQKVRENAGGMFGGAVEQEVARIERLKNQELADMAIQYKVAAGDYNDAFEIVQAKIDAEFEPLKNEIASLTNLYNLYQNDLTESEKIQVQANINEKAAQLDFQRQLQRDRLMQQFDLQKLAIQQGFDLAKDEQKLTQEQSQQKGEALNAYQLANEILNSNFSGAVGLPSIGKFIPGTSTQYVKNQIKQLKGFLSLENRSKLKGSGAVSDFEAKTLEQAASSLGMNLKEKDFEKEMKKVRGALGTAAGLSVPVLIKNPKTGEKQVLNADRSGIESAIADGMLVEYQ